jgi:hypothetical protein
MYLPVESHIVPADTAPDDDSSFHFIKSALLKGKSQHRYQSAIGESIKWLYYT